MKKFKKRSLKQQWVSERLFSSKGQLGQVRQLLLHVAKKKSTLPQEARILTMAANQISGVKVGENKKESWELFNGRVDSE